MNVFHVGFFFENLTTAGSKVGRINAAIGTVSLDWIRYGNFSWILFTYSSADQVHIAIREAIDKNDQFLIVPINLNAPRQGLLAPWIWDYIKLDRTRAGWQAERDRLVDQNVPPPPPPPPQILPLSGEGDYLGLLGILGKKE